MPSSSHLFGVLNIRKPPGVTSRDVVNRIQRLIRPIKCGHAGTLDPMATGVLLVCIGPATRLASMLQEGMKRYLAEFTLGQVSDTDDNTGQIEHRSIPDPLPSSEQIELILERMTRSISQVPPDYSAVRVDGQRAYSLARRGKEVSLKAKQIQIHAIRMLGYRWPRLDLEIICGSGTYIRSIARDLGEELCCGGLMSRLQRTSIGSFSETESVAADDLTRENIGDFCAQRSGSSTLCQKFDCTPEDVSGLLCGRIIPCNAFGLLFDPPLRPGQKVALTRNGCTELLALAEVNAEGCLQPRIVFLQSSES